MRTNLPSVLLLLQALTAQQVIVVDSQNRPGTNFRDLPPALTAAADGNVLRVRDGNYSVGRVDIRNKTLHVIGEDGATLQCDGLFNLFTIGSIPAGKTVVIHNFSLLGDAIGITVENCQGSVMLSKLRYTAAMPTPNFNIRVSNSTRVEVAEIDFRGALGIFGSSNVSVRQSHFDLRLVASFLRAPMMVEGPAFVELADTSLFATPSSLGPTPLLLVPSGAGAPTLIIRGSSSTRLVAGIDPRPFPISAIMGTGTVLLDPSVTLTATGGAPLIAPTVAVTRRALPRLLTTPAAPGTNANIRLHGGAGEPFALVVGVPGSPFAVPGLLTGRSWTQGQFTVASGVLDTGTVNITIPIPANNSFRASLVAWQGFVVGASGLVATNPGFACFPF